MKMDYKFFIPFITIFYYTKSCNANTLRRLTFGFSSLLVSLPYSLHTNVEIADLFFYCFKNRPLKRQPHYYDQDFIAQR